MGHVPDLVPVCAVDVAWDEDVFGEFVAEWVVFVVPCFGAGDCFLGAGGVPVDLGPWGKEVVAVLVGGVEEVFTVFDEDVPDDDCVFDCAVFLVEQTAVEEVVLVFLES